MHEQSETVERDGKFFNVYGAATPKAGKVLPGEPAYNTVKEAVTAAKNRSERYGREHNPEGNNMVAPSQSDVRKVDNEMAKKAEKPPSNYQDVMDAKTRALEEKAKTTKTGMGDKLFAKGGKIKRYSGEDDSDVRTPEGEFKMSGLGDRTIAETNATEAGSAMPAEKPKGSVDFNQRFREEMKRFKDEGGDKSFEYNGKKYALEYAKPKAAAPAAPAKERFARAVTGITSYDSTRKDREAKQDRDMGIANEKAMAKDKGPNLPAYRAMKPLRRGDSMKTGGAIKKYASGGSIRGDGIAQRGKTKGRIL